MCNSLKQKRGFSLVELLVSMGLGTIMLVIVTSFLNHSAQVQKGAELSADLNSVAATIAKALQNSDICTSSLAGTTLAADSWTSIASGAIQSGAQGQDFVFAKVSDPTDEKKQFYKIDSIEVYTFTPAVLTATATNGFDFYQARVRINASTWAFDAASSQINKDAFSKATMPVGTQTFTREFNITAMTDKGTMSFEKCFSMDPLETVCTEVGGTYTPASPDGSAASCNANATMCSLVAGATYDAVNKKCVFPNPGGA